LISLPLVIPLVHLPRNRCHFFLFCVCMGVGMCVCVCVYGCMGVGMCMCVYGCMGVGMCVCVCVYTCVYMGAGMCVCVYVYGCRYVCLFHIYYIYYQTTFCGRKNKNNDLDFFSLECESTYF
jgi:hypothetical protein